jgi:hypothetical protein
VGLSHFGGQWSDSQSNPFGEDHVPNRPEELARARLAERSIVNKPFAQTGWPSPSRHRRRLVPVSHVDMKTPVAVDLEKCDLTVVRMRSIFRESSNRCLQRLDIRRP